MTETFDFEPVAFEELSVQHLRIQEELRQQGKELNMLEDDFYVGNDNGVDVEGSDVEGEEELGQGQHKSLRNSQHHLQHHLQQYSQQMNGNNAVDNIQQQPQQQTNQPYLFQQKQSSSSHQQPQQNHQQQQHQQTQQQQPQQNPQQQHHSQLPTTTQGPHLHIQATTPNHTHVQLLPLHKQHGNHKKTKTCNKAGRSFQDPSAEERIRSLKKKFNCKDLLLKNTLGTGTFGRVVLVHHASTQIYFALKVLQITEVVRLKQVQHVKNEKNILLNLSHPFIVKMYWSSHTKSHLYMLMEYVCGGELFTYLRNAGYFTNDTALFYASEILLVLEYMHSHKLIYRDLKPENLLLDKHGHLKITDFGFAKKLDDRSWTLCGTPEYLAPEIIQNKGHNKAVDWWAFGILIYEMLTGYPPFYDEQPTGIYEKILQGTFDFPKHVESHARDLIRKLLSKDRTRRLGNMKNGSDDVKNHKWFKRLSWKDVYDKKLHPPIVPRVRHTGDTRNFFDYPEENSKNQHLVLPPTDSLECITTPDHIFDDF